MLMYLGLAVVLFVLIILMRLMRSSEKGGGPNRTFRIHSLPMVGEPGDFRASIGAGAGASGDPATRLRQLQDMKDAGLITDDEYDAKRSEILDKI